MKQFWSEFKAFALKGNVFDLAVGVIIGGAFGKIVSSLVDNIIMPLFGVILGGVKFDELGVTIGDSAIKYGVFLQNVVDFLIISLTIFCFIKLAARFTHRQEEKVPDPPKKSDEVLLLEEILDALRAAQGVPSASEISQAARPADGEESGDEPEE